MRYNGGGLVRVAEYLIDLIGGGTVKGENIIKILYNDKHTDSNFSYTGKKLQNSLEKISKVVFITTRGTASASEMVINALTPYFDVALVGEMTYGKPVGMNSMSFCDQTIVPITFKSANSQDYGDYFLGMDVDCSAEDDCRHDFGLLHHDQCHKVHLSILVVGQRRVCQCLGQSECSIHKILLLALRQKQWHKDLLQ